MAVPEAPVNENGRFVFHQYDVWSAREILFVKAEAVSHPVEERANYSLRACVGPLYLTHVPTAACSS